MRFINLVNQLPENHQMYYPMNTKKVNALLFFPNVLSLCFILGSMLIMASCNSNQESESAPAASDTVAAPEVKKEDVKFLIPATYTADWKIGDPEKVNKVLQMYLSYSVDSNYDAVLPMLADSITNLSFDDKITKLSNKDYVSLVRNFRKQFKKVNEEFISYVSLHSDAMNTDQVGIWVKERVIRKNDRPDSTTYHEVYRFNDQGKINFRGVYARYSK
jgi:hypothetical protein